MRCTELRYKEKISNSRMRGIILNIAKIAALAGVAALTLAGCAAGADSDATEETASTETAATETEAPAASDIKICVYTHGDGGTFWSVAQAGA
jgi:simple sugar transport system substrate-binding protein